jgi:hypothetical protein
MVCATLFSVGLRISPLAALILDIVRYAIRRRKEIAIDTTNGINFGGL